MWCVCFKSNDDFAVFSKEWENEIETIITNIKKAKRLGKICMNNRLLLRKDPKLEKEILELINRIDCDIIRTKRKAIQFLTDSTSLYTQRSQQLEFRRNYIKKQIRTLEMRKEVLELKGNYKMLYKENELLKNQNIALLEYLKGLKQNKNTSAGSVDNKSLMSNDELEYFIKMYGQPVVSDPEFIQLRELHKRQLETMISKYDIMINNLREHTSNYKKEEEEIKRYNKFFQENEEEEKDEHQGIDNESNEKPIEDEDIFDEMSFWLEQELENRKLLQINSNIGEIYGGYNRSRKDKNTGFGSRFKFPVLKRSGQRFRTLNNNDSLEQPILDNKNQEQTTKLILPHSEPGTSKSTSALGCQKIELLTISKKSIKQY